MRRLVLLSVLGIAAVGVGASLVILSVGGVPWAPPAPSQAAGEGRSAAAAAPMVPRPAPVAPSRDEPVYSGPRRLRLPDRVAARDLTAPLADCLRAHPTTSNGGATLTLELEALSGGGLRIVEAPVAAWGNASRSLVACAQQVLQGRTISIGAYAPGERFRARYVLESALPDPEPPAPSSLVARQPSRRAASGGGRR